MSRNHDATDCAPMKPKPCPGGTLESDCCLPTRIVGTLPKQHIHGAFTSSGITKNACLFDEDYDSGVALSCSKTSDEGEIPYDTNNCSVIKEKNRILFCDEDSSPKKFDEVGILRIDNEFTNLHVGLNLNNFSEPGEVGHRSRTDGVASEGLFNWDLVFKQDQDGDTPLHIAVMLDTQLDFAQSVINLCLVTQFLDLQNDLLQTALHLAVILHRTQVIQALVSRGAALFVCDLNGNTPLHLACQMGYTDAVRVLTQNSRTQSEKRILRRIIHHRNYEGMTCCHLSAKSSALDNLFYLIEDCGADINIQEGKRGMTILHMAAESNNLTLVAFLVECSSINLNQFTYDGWTALDLAMGRRLKEMENKLSKVGAWHSEETDTSSSGSQSDEENFEEERNDLEIF